jgi:hypothetical protein
MVSRHDHPWNTESALHGARGDERALQRARLAVPFKTFDGDDVLPIGFGGEDETGAHGCAVHHDRAGAAFPFGAALFGAGEPELIPQQFEQGPVRDRLDLEITAVDAA